MNPYLESYYQVDFQQVDGNINCLKNEERKRLTPHGNMLAARLMRLKKMSESVDSNVTLFASGLGLIVCLAWVFLVVTKNTLALSIFKLAKENLPNWLGMLLFYDMMSFVWSFLIGFILGSVGGVFFTRRLYWRIDIMRTKIIANNPSLLEALSEFAEQR